MAARRAPGQRPDHAGLDDASSGHAGSTSEKHAGGAAGNCPPLARNALTGRQEPSAAASPRHHNESTDDSLRVGQHGSDLFQGETSRKDNATKSLIAWSFSEIGR